MEKAQKNYRAQIEFYLKYKEKFGENPDDNLFKLITDRGNEEVLNGLIKTPGRPQKGKRSDGMF